MGNDQSSKRRRWLRAILVAAIVGFLLLGAGWILYQYVPRHTPAGQPELVELPAGDLDAFTAAFNGASSSVRVVLMLSPT
jgi:hypothetical protein